jgi:hypothetical protein
MFHVHDFDLLIWHILHISALSWESFLLCFWQIKANTITSIAKVLVSSLHMQKRVCEVSFSNAQYVKIILDFVDLILIGCDSQRGATDRTAQLFHYNIKEQQNFCGLLLPLEAIYISEDPPMFLTRLLSIFSISQVFSWKNMQCYIVINWDHISNKHR